MLLLLLSTADICNLAFSLLPFLFRGRAKGMKGKCSVLTSLEAFIDLQPVSILQCQIW